MQIRKIIAKRLLESKQQVPHLYVRADAALDPVSALRESMKQQGTKVSRGVLTCLALSACSQAGRGRASLLHLHCSLLIEGGSL